MNISRINILYHLQNYYLTEDVCNSDVICFLIDKNLINSMKQRPSLEADTGARLNIKGKSLQHSSHNSPTVPSSKQAEQSEHFSGNRLFNIQFNVLSWFKLRLSQLSSFSPTALYGYFLPSIRYASKEILLYFLFSSPCPPPLKCEFFN